MKFQEVILALQEFWSGQGCILAQPYDVEKGAGTMSPWTFLRVLGPEPWNVAYVEPSRRPADGRYGDNPNRLYQHHQFQVIMKPSPNNIQELYLESLARLGIRAAEHDIRFVEDNWESPTLGAWGLGWEVWLDGMEITQFTYFQQVGSHDVKPVSVEITYGLERLAMYIQGVENVYDIAWTDDVTYGDVFHQNEFEQSTYAFDLSDEALLLTNMRQRQCASSVRGMCIPRMTTCSNVRTRLTYLMHAVRSASRSGRHLSDASENLRVFARRRIWPSVRRSATRC